MKDLLLKYYGQLLDIEDQIKDSNSSYTSERLQAKKSVLIEVVRDMKKVLELEYRS